MKKIFFLIGFLIVSIVCQSQNSPEDLTNKFFKKFEKNTDEAFDYLFGTNEWMADNKDGTEKVKFQIREYATLMGEYIGYEKIAEKSLGESLSVAVYLVKYERQPLRFIFKYYKAKKEWVLYNIKFDEDIDDELDEIMKYDYLSY